MTTTSSIPDLGRLRMFKLTWPYVSTVLKRHWRLIFLLVVISVLLGFVPTIKSELEAGLINQISQTISSSASATYTAARPESFLEAVTDVLSIRISRFERVEADQDWPERIAGFLFGRVGVGLALLFYLVLSVAAYSVDLLTTVFQTRISQEVFAKLRSIGLTKGLVTDPAQLPATLSNTAGQYSNAIQVGAANVGNTYGYLLDAGQHFLSLGTALFLVFTKSPQFAIACLVIVLLQVWLSYAQGRRLRAKRQDLDLRRNDLLARTDDVLSKREIILAYERQKDYRNKLEDYTRGYADVVRTLTIKEKLYSLISRLITDYGRMIILLVGLLVTLGLARRGGGEQLVNIGDAYFFISIYTRILFPATDLLRKYDSLKESEATSRTFLSVLREDALSVGATSDIPSLSSGATSAPVHVDEAGTAVAFRDVFFKYPVAVEGPSQKVDREKWVLNGVSFHIPARKTTLVLGRSGCGKTTIARILLGFWRPEKGEVTIFGRALSEYNGDELRALMAYVSQGDHIIDDTVKENLAWGYTRDGQSISEERMLDTLESLKMFDTEEERQRILKRFARELSGGQQQRLSFARMMLDESEIVILDEPFAGVDTFTISEIRKQLTQIFDSSKRTVLMFSHRLAFAKFADHVIIFGKNGKIIEEGPPSELLKNKNGEFTKLYTQARDDLEVQHITP